MTEIEAKLDRCKYLFLADIRELGGNRLRVTIEEGKPLGIPDRNGGPISIADCTRIEIMPESESFELEWPRYVAYAVVGESYASQPGAEQSFTGTRFRTYAKSHFRDYVSRSTFATDEYPGLLSHYEICCEYQTINVVSTLPPAITIGWKLDPERQQQRPFRM